jgi:hypothetical protein
MGMFHNFLCSHCGYKAQVNGGLDSLDYLTFETMFCADCSKLVDALVEFRPRWLRRQRNKKGGYETKKRCVVFCPNCNGIHLLPWEKHYPCPKCSGEIAAEKAVRYLE